MSRILIIDDDAEMAADTAAALTSDGHEVAVHPTTEGALQILANHPPDLLILDVMFPENPVAGFELARQIRRTRKIRDLPILLMTNVNQEFPMDFSAKDIDRGWMPVQDFTEKPLPRPQLLALVNKLLKAAR